MSIERILKEKGIVRNKLQANAVMIIVTLICLIVAISISRGSSSQSNFDESLLSPAEKEFLGIQDQDFE